MSKKQEKQYSISISTEDFTYDTKNNIVQMVDSEGKTVAVDTWKYAIYFFENIQRKDISEHSVYLDGLRLDKFVEIFIKDKNHQKISTFLTDDYSCFLHHEMLEKYGTYINWVALYGLCAYIREIINRRYALLLKPTLKDTVEEIGGLDNLESVTFNLKNGNKHSTDFCNSMYNFSFVSNKPGIMRGIMWSTALYLLLKSCLNRDSVTISGEKSKNLRR